MEPADLEALAASLDGMREAGIRLTDGATRITVEGLGHVDVPAGSSSWIQHDAPGVYPNVPHGQSRDSLLFGILKDSGEAAGPRLDSELQDALKEQLVPAATPDQRATIAQAMEDKFWTTVKQPYLLPLHASLALGFDQAGGKDRDQRMRYKMFRGSILPFLCSRSDGSVDEQVMDRLLDVFRSDEDFTILDREVLRIAGELSPDTSGPTVEALMSSGPSKAALQRLQELGGAFCQPSLDMFQGDLRHVLRLPLPRRDLIDQITMLLALHLSVRLFRASVVLARQMDEVTSIYAGSQREAGVCSSGCAGKLEQCHLAGMLRFRVGSGAFRSVSLTDPCVTSFREVTSRYLMPLPVTIATANLAIEVLRQLGGHSLSSLDLPGLKAALLQADDRFRRAYDSVLRLLALACGAWQNPAATADELLRFADQDRPGLFALREAILERRRPSMRHEGRDVVSQLVKDVRSGRLIKSNGSRATFFEVDEPLLFLLVTIICKDRMVPFAEFLDTMRQYGLQPQDRDEEAALQRSLERLGVFARYSDAAESAYVHAISRNDNLDGALR